MREQRSLPDEGDAMNEGNPAPPEQIREMFDRIAHVYDAMNSLISGMQEPRWRRRAIQESRLGPGMRALDVACGTGKATADLAATVSPAGLVVGVDFSPHMLRMAKERYGGRPGITFVLGDALNLPFGDAAFDAATILFGMRNLRDYRRGFAEMHRVVRHGGRVVCLEIARPRRRVGRLAATWFDHAIPLFGGLVGHRQAYAYLVRSVKDYPEPERVAQMMREVGLADVRWFELSGGIVTIHAGVADHRTDHEVHPDRD
ncbi:MAG TPA: ubiquinone/menaquinone biosynthesis methyltransferase [Candidatus Caenarcaniphilales bacterium]|nr:ubiquinone/menaquinone biosynthesis methyltransferase [Candidatus Caenarcaniphilales bacterium]